jgi:hypothetical protein
MKTITKQCIFICALLLGLWSCTNEKKETQDANTKIIQADAPCNGILLRGENYEKEAEIAKAQIAHYEEEYEKLINKKIIDANFLSKGAKVKDIDELYELVCHMRNTGGELYIMNAITQVENSQGVKEDKTDMIFVVVPEAKSDAKSDTDPNIYLNFTQACPTSCPNIGS